ncbi:hypothetical protein ACW2Q0_08940 [Nocardia sp. R16R-3T]
MLVRLADELHDTGDISDAVWTRLAERDADDQILELIIIASWYRLLSTVISSARVEFGPWTRRYPARTPQFGVAARS